MSKESKFRLVYGNVILFRKRKNMFWSSYIYYYYLRFLFIDEWILNYFIEQQNRNVFLVNFFSIHVSVFNGAGDPKKNFYLFWLINS